MALLYDSKKLIPAPFVRLRKDYITSDDGSIIGTTFTITLLGKIVSHKGSPDSSGTFWTASGYPSDEVLDSDENMTAIIRKQEAIRGLFANEGRMLEVQMWDGMGSMKCNPRIKSIEFPEGQPVSWYNLCDYVITMEADIVYMNGTDLGEDAGDPLTYKVSRASEEWNMESADDQGRTYRLTHNVSAVGKRFYDDTGALTQQAWENAKDYVINKLGLGLVVARMQCPDVLDADDLQAFNYLRVQQLSELGGTFSVTESWLCYDPGGESPAIEDWSVNIRTQQDGITRVSVEGQIQGLEVRDNSTYAVTSTKYTNASAKWGTYVQPNLKTRAETISGLTMHATPLSTQVSHNQNNGVISYSYEYDDRADFTIAGALSEIVTIDDDAASDVYASIPVLGRAFGPVLQDIGTVTSLRRSIQIEIQMPAATQSATPTKPNTNTIITDNTPVATDIFLDADKETWTERTGRYTRSVTFTYQT